MLHLNGWPKCLALLLLFCPAYLSAQLLPAHQRHNWQAVSDIPAANPSMPVVSILNYGGRNDSSADNSAALSQAIQALGGNGGMVHFPAGKYRFNSTQQLPAGIIIRGAGANDTRFYFDLGGSPSNCFEVMGSGTGNLRDVIQGYTEGSSILKVSDTSGLRAGAFAEIREENGSWDVVPAAWATYSVGQLLLIDSVRNNQVYLRYPLRITYDTALHPQIRPISLQQGNGFSCFYIERIDEPASGAGYNFLFEQAAYGFIRGVESNKSVGSHVMISLSSHIQVQGNYFHDAFTFDGAGTRGYGLTLDNHSGSCLVENNIFRKLRHAMMVKYGANGNVLAYNYSLEPRRSEAIPDFSGDISLHGHYAYANLFEGNIVQNIIIDHYWGPSGPDNVFLRNRSELYGIIATTGTPQTAEQAFIGNETTNTGSLMGNFSIPGSGHFHYGNSILGVVQPSGTGVTNDTSYYRTTVPAFWHIAAPWPSIGYPNTVNQYTIPAKQRYMEQHYSICSETEPGGPMHTKEVSLHTGITVFPNPSQGIITLPEGEKVSYINDLQGCHINWTQSGTKVSLIHVIPGIYILNTVSGKYVRVVVLSQS
jgi:hypothetical protein